MTPLPNRPVKKNAEELDSSQRAEVQSQDKTPQQGKNQQEEQQKDIVSKMVATINGCKDGLHEYGTRNMVEDTEKLGELLVKKGLKTNQIRKFLDAINQLRVQVRNSSDLTSDEKSELDLLRPKLAYAAARQQKNNDPGPVEPLRKVLEAAIKQIDKKQDFVRLTQLVESIVAYHKASGGKDQ